MTGTPSQVGFASRDVLPTHTTTPPPQHVPFVPQDTTPTAPHALTIPAPVVPVGTRSQPESVCSPVPLVPISTTRNASIAPPTAPLAPVQQNAPIAPLPHICSTTTYATPPVPTRRTK